MKKFSIIVLVLLLISGAYGIAKPAKVVLKIGMIDVEKIVDSSPQVKVMLDKAKQQFAPQDNKIKELQKKFADKLKNYALTRDKMNEKQRQEYQISFNKLQQELYSARMEYNNVIFKAREEALQTVSKQIHAIAEKIAKKEQINLVLVKGAIIYKDPNAVQDISNSVIEVMKQQ